MIRIDNLVGKDGYVHTVDPVTKELCTKRFYNVRKTRENAKIITIELDSGDKIDLTPDHLVLTNNRGWVEAESLTIDDDIVTAID